jgi:hypothetical protein
VSRVLKSTSICIKCSGRTREISLNIADISTEKLWNKSLKDIVTKQSNTVRIWPISYNSWLKELGHFNKHLLTGRVVSTYQRVLHVSTVERPNFGNILKAGAVSRLL